MSETDKLDAQDDRKEGREQPEHTPSGLQAAEQATAITHERTGNGQVQAVKRANGTEEPPAPLSELSSHPGGSSDLPASSPIIAPAKPSAERGEATLQATGQEAAPTISPEDDDSDQKWPLKSIHWPPLSAHASEVKILMQDMNGPCSFLALCNVLLLRGDITLPLHHDYARFSHLSSLVADYLLRTSSVVPGSPLLQSANPLDFALSMLPKTLSGLDVNVNFVDGTFSRPEGTVPGELELFQLAGVDIRHGWYASKEDSETYAVLSSTASDYDTAVMKLVEGDEIAGGAITDSSNSGDTAKLERLFEELSVQPDKQAKVYQASLIRRFLDTTSTQLTYAGLFKLSESLQPGSLCALFRNSHFSVLYRRPDAVPEQLSFAYPSLPSATLFHLVTDAALLHEPSAIWESLEDVDGASSRFYDSSLQPARIRQDWVSRQSRTTEERRQLDDGHDVDVALAMQMQQDEYARDAYIRQQERQQQEVSTNARIEQPVESGRLNEARTEVGGKKKEQVKTGAAKATKPKAAKKDKKDCIVS